MIARKESNLKNQDTASAIIERYTNQPTRMPTSVRSRIEQAWGGEPVQLYALADLSDELRLSSAWLALGPNHIAMVSGDTEEGDPVVSIERKRIRKLREIPGLSCNTLVILGEPDEPALAVLRYTHRQRRAMENIRFVLEQAIEGHEVPTKDPDEVYANSLARPIQEAQSSVQVNKLAVVWRLLGYLKPYKWRVTFGMTAAALITLCGLVPPILTRHLIDGVITPFQKGSIEIGVAWTTALWLLAVLAGVIFMRQVFGFIRLYTMAVLGEYIARDLRTELYEHLQSLSLSYFSSKQTGSLISRVSSDTDRLWDFVAFGIVEVSLAIVMLVGLGGMLISMDWQLGLAMMVPVPFMLWLIFHHGSKMKNIFTRCWRKWSNMTAVLANTIPGMKVVKAFHQEEQEKRRFNSHNNDCLSEFNRVHIYWTRFWPGLMLGVHSMVILVWLVAMPRLLNTGDTQLTVGTFVSFLMYVGMFFFPIETIGQMQRLLHRATSSAHRIFEVLDTEPQVVEVENARKLEPVGGHVVFDNVTFAYDGVRQVIRGISFDVKPGEMIGLVGPSGAGKTTVINLLVRFYDVTGGKILVDGVDLRELDIGHYRRQVGMVLQDPYLFHGTVLENIRYGRPDADLDKVVEAAQAANAHDFICKLPHGYDTIVGERGHTLSGGERQRVSIARAILNDPRILILDEATSSVDTETERKIQEALDRLIAGRTVFAIAHRLSTLRRASRLFVIEDGRITEEGTHAELLDMADGTYTKLHNMQQELHEMYAV